MDLNSHFGPLILAPSQPKNHIFEIDPSLLTSSSDLTTNASHTESKESVKATSNTSETQSTRFTYKDASKMRQKITKKSAEPGSLDFFTRKPVNNTVISSPPAIASPNDTPNIIFPDGQNSNSKESLVKQPSHDAFSLLLNTKTEKASVVSAYRKSKKKAKTIEKPKKSVLKSTETISHDQSEHLADELLVQSEKAEKDIFTSINQTENSDASASPSHNFMVSLEVTPEKLKETEKTHKKESPHNQFIVSLKVTPEKLKSVEPQTARKAPVTNSENSLGATLSESFIITLKLKNSELRDPKLAALNTAAPKPEISEKQVPPLLSIKQNAEDHVKAPKKKSKASTKSVSKKTSLNSFLGIAPQPAITVSDVPDTLPDQSSFIEEKQANNGTAETSEKLKKMVILKLPKEKLADFDFGNSVTKSSKQQNAKKKPVHPFFLQQKKKKSENSKISSFSTPSKNQASPLTNRVLVKGIKSLSTQPKPRYIQPEVWPSPGQLHVRGNVSYLDPLYKALQLSPIIPLLEAIKSKKKGKELVIPPEKSILNLMFGSLRALHEQKKSLKIQNSLKFVPPNIRIPFQQALTSRVIREIIDDEIVDPVSRDVLAPLFDKACYYISQFESHSYETQCWADKYKPTIAASVITSRYQAVSIRDWISNRIDYLKTIKPARQSKRKKRTKKTPRQSALNNNLDGFIVDDDEIEYADPDEYTDMSFDDSMDQTESAMSFIESSSNSNVFANDAIPATSDLLIVHGPHGSGKSSAVYAACQELGVYVFESNPGERRSGKYIMEKLGGMAKSHLVHKQKGMFSGGEPLGFFSAQKSNNFFEDDETSPSPSFNQQQTNHQHSVILLDEADILFDDDSSFWPAMEKFLESVQRPVIITCNDISRIPPSIVLKFSVGFLELSPANLDLQKNALWMIGLCEGHLLDSHSLQDLVLANKFDFRKSLNHLQFWCQMALGDRFSAVNWLMATSDTAKEMKLRQLEDDELNTDEEITRFISNGTFIGVTQDYSNNSIDIDYLSRNKLEIDTLNVPDIKYLEDQLDSLSFDLKTQDPNISISSWANIYDAFSCADVMKSQTNSQLAPELIIKNLKELSEDEELPLPPDYVFGDYYFGSGNSIPGISKPLPFEKQLHGDVIRQAIATAQAAAPGDSNNSIQMVPATSTIAISNPSEHFRLVLDGLNSLGYNSIDCHSSQVVATEVSPYVRLLAQDDIKREELLNSIAPASQSHNYYDDELYYQNPGSSDTEPSGSQSRTRTTMRAAYASLGQSAAEAMSYNKRYLPNNINLQTIVNSAPHSWSNYL